MIYRDNCGNTQYELAAMVDGGALDFYEEAEAFGTCYAGYYNCSNTWVNAGSYIGGEHIQQDYSTDYADYVYWELDDWIVEGYTSCNNGNSNDQQIVVVNDQSPTPDFAASCY